MSSEIQSVAVIGGGIGGLAASIGLTMSGRDVTLCEQAEEFGEVGAGLQLGPNAVRALRALGAFDDVDAFSHKPGSIRIMCGLSGKCLKVLPLGQSFEDRFGAPYRLAHRADLHCALLNRAREVGVELVNGVHLETVEADATSATPVFDGGTGPGAFDLVVGADGVQSEVRGFVNPGVHVTPQGHSLARGLIENFEPDDLHNGKDVHLWLLPGGHVVHYPVSGGRALNIVAAFEEDWFEWGWKVPTTLDHVLTRFERATPALKDVLKRCNLWTKWAALGLSGGNAGESAWHKGRVCLLGDAVHPTLPYIAQGAALAMEDAVELADCLKESSGLELYAARRWQRCARAVAEARRMGQVYHLGLPWRVARNIVISLSSSDWQLGRLGWVYNWKRGA